MAQLAEIKNSVREIGKAEQTTIWVNPLNVTSVESIRGGTYITMSDGKAIVTMQGVADVVKIIQDVML
jgi:uncharacterized protein YlzI (FlbEa/FlbD family)